MRLKATSDLWWKNAVLYCLDVETFLDSDGDGCGDLAGLTERPLTARSHAKQHCAAILRGRRSPCHPPLEFVRDHAEYRRAPPRG
jgi:hypothetical protein